MNEEQGYEVVDKRLKEDEPTAEQAETPAAEEPAAETQPEQPQAEGTEDHEHVGLMDAYGIAAFAIQMLVQSAWQKMGLHTDPGTGKIEKDMEQARFAIDCISVLYDKMHPKLDETARRDGRAMISDLQINFVNQSQKENASS